MINRNIIMLGLALLVLAALAFGFFVPVGTYTSQNSCLSSETSHVITKKITLIKGQSLTQVRQASMDEGIEDACTLPTKYNLYIL